MSKLKQQSLDRTFELDSARKPSGWAACRLDHLGSKGRRPVLKAGPFGSSVTKDIYVTAGFKVYGQQEVVGRDVNAENYYVTEEVFLAHESCAVEPGDILITMMGTIGRVFEVPDGAEQGIINPRLMRLSVDRSRALQAFVASFLESDGVQRLLERRSHGGTMQGLNTQALASLEIPLPPILEQRKIAAILRVWDEAIEKLEALRSAKSRRLTGLRSGLLFGSMRLQGARTNWEPRRLADVTQELSDRNSDLELGREAVMGVTNTRGIVPMREHTVAEDISRYKRLPLKAFAYNPMRINVGSIAMNHGPYDVLVSPDYVVFACKSGGLEPDYLDHLRQTFWWTHYITSGGSGSVRHLPLPDIIEQQRIVHVLNTAKDDLLATERMIGSFARQRRGLSQKLLTGEWRVKIDGEKEAAA
jgi:type I restriction enzyme S subunit